LPSNAERTANNDSLNFNHKRAKRNGTLESSRILTIADWRPSIFAIPYEVAYDNPFAHHFHPGIAMRSTAITLGFLVLVSLLSTLKTQAADPYVSAGFMKLPTDIELGAVSAVAVDSKDRVYVLHRGEPPVLAFDSELKFVKGWGTSMFKTAHGLRVDASDNIWTTDNGNHVLRRFNSNGRLLQTIGEVGKPGKGDFQFKSPDDLLFDSDGNVYVADAGNGRIIKYSREGKFISEWGTKGKQKGEFAAAHGLAIDAKNRIYVADRGNERVQVFDNSGKHIADWSGFGNPFGLLVIGDQLLVSQGDIHKLFLLNQEGEIDASWGNPETLLLPHLMAMNSKGVLFVAEVKGNRVQMFKKAKTNKIAVMETALGKRGEASSLLDAKNAGYNAIQMHSGVPEGFKKPIDSSLGLPLGKDESVVESWKAASQKHGVEIMSLCAGSLNKCEIWDEDREVSMRIAKQTIDACHALNVKTMLFPFFGPSNFQTNDEAFNGVAQFMRELLPYAKEKGVIIGIEAPVTTVRVLELMKILEYPENLKIYYDTGNLFKKEDIYETIRKHGKQHFCEIHIKAAGNAVAGMGQIDLAKLAAALDDAEYDRWLVYEANRDGKDPVANRRAIEKLISLRK